MQHVNRNSSRTPGFDPRLFLRDEELDYGISLILTGERVLMREAAHLSSRLNIPPLAARVLTQEHILYPAVLRRALLGVKEPLFLP